MALAHFEEAEHRYNQTGTDVPKDKTIGCDQQTPDDMTLSQTSHKRDLAGDNWRRSPKTGDDGEKLCMAYAPGGTKGQSK